jgi:hypothetical protein
LVAAGAAASQTRRTTPTEVTTMNDFTPQSSNAWLFYVKASFLIALAAIGYRHEETARRAAGRPIAQADCQIASIAHTRGATVATRNTPDFEGCEIDLINPWTAA